MLWFRVNKYYSMTKYVFLAAAVGLAVTAFFLFKEDELVLGFVSLLVAFACAQPCLCYWAENASKDDGELDNDDTSFEEEE